MIVQPVAQQIPDLTHTLGDGNHFRGETHFGLGLAPGQILDSSVRVVDLRAQAMDVRAEAVDLRVEATELTLYGFESPVGTLDLLMDLL